MLEWAINVYLLILFLDSWPPETEASEFKKYWIGLKTYPFY